MATPTAVMRWAGETSSTLYEPSIESVLLVVWLSVVPGLAEGLDEDELEKKEVG